MLRVGKGNRGEGGLRQCLLKSFGGVVANFAIGIKVVLPLKILYRTAGRWAEIAIILDGATAVLIAKCGQFRWTLATSGPPASELE